MVRADLEKKTAHVAAMFDEVAAGYDRTRARLWWGRMDAWSRRMADAAEAVPGQLILDVAAGTGTSSEALARAHATVVACDLSPGMLAVAGRRHPGLSRVAADARALPFATDDFDAVTIAFGLRNISNPEMALREMLRVTRPGGRLVICEFSMPPSPLARVLWRQYLRRAVPMIGRRISSNPEAYVYLAESIQAWPAPPALAEQVAEAGWRDVSWHRLDGGIVHLHTATAPASRPE